jgi:hypothetical protein
MSEAAAEGGGAYTELDRRKGPRPATIKNKAKRAKVLAEQRAQRAKDKRETRRKRKREAEELGDAVSSGGRACLACLLPASCMPRAPVCR